MRGFRNLWPSSCRCTSQRLLGDWLAGWAEFEGPGAGELFQRDLSSFWGSVWSINLCFPCHFKAWFCSANLRLTMPGPSWSCFLRPLKLWMLIQRAPSSVYILCRMLATDRHAFYILLLPHSVYLNATDPHISPLQRAQSPYFLVPTNRSSRSSFALLCPCPWCEHLCSVLIKGEKQSWTWSKHGSQFQCTEDHILVLLELICFLFQESFRGMHAWSITIFFCVIEFIDCCCTRFAWSQKPRT